MNTNPALLLALALSVVDATEQDRQCAELRIHPGNGAGYYLAQARQPGRWYWRESSDADHFNRAEQAELDDAIDHGVHVVLTGNRGCVLRLWHGWGEFSGLVITITVLR